MPRFKLDLQFTEEGLKKSKDERAFIRERHAKPFAQNNGVTVISTAEKSGGGGVTWIVEGEESAVLKVVAQFNNPILDISNNPIPPPHGPPTVRAKIVP